MRPKRSRALARIESLRQKGEDSMQIRVPRSLLFLVFLISSIPLFSQNRAPVNDPQAVVLATKAVAALTNGVPVTDVTLTGTATWTAGSDVEKGTVTLKARGTAQSRMDLALSGGNRSEIRATSNGFPQGAWIGSDGKSKCLRFPQLLDRHQLVLSHPLVPRCGSDQPECCSVLRGRGDSKRRYGRASTIKYVLP